MFVVPAIVLGFATSIPMMHFLYSILFTEDLGFKHSIYPETPAVIQALCLGLLIPAISAIVPIRRALSTNLTDALTPQRRKSSGVLVSIAEGNLETILSYVLFGAIGVIFGVSIYYYLPLSLLHENYSLMLQIFFVILLGMLLGLTILAMNLQGILETLLIYVLLFWESKSMRRMLSKNLVAHKQRNLLTSIIYALTLGCIIFLVVSANLQLK